MCMVYTKRLSRGYSANALCPLFLFFEKNKKQGVKGSFFPLQVSFFLKNGITCYTRVGGQGVERLFVALLSMDGWGDSTNLNLYQFYRKGE